MFKFLFGMLCGAGGMYYISDTVQDRCEKAAAAWEAKEKSKEHIQALTQEMVMDWIHKGILIEQLQMYEERLKIQYNSQLPPKVWEDAMAMQAAYSATTLK
jgi:hypothetical protein